MKKRSFAVTVAVLLLAGAVSAPAGAQARALTFVGCSEMALRNAVTASNGMMGGDSLSLMPYCVYTLTTPLPTLTEPLGIDGHHATIRRDPTVGAFGIFDVGPVGLGMLDLTVMNGSNSDGGGAVALTVPGGSLTTTDVDFLGNTGGSGGAILAGEGTMLHLTGGTVGDNRGVVGAGGIAASGESTTVTLQSVTVSGNRSAGYGGGISLGIGGQTTLVNTTIRANTAQQAAGGIYFTGAGPMVASNVRITDNRVSNSAEGGGGILLNTEGTAPTAQFTDSTISGNTVTGFGTADDLNSRGGGVFVENGVVVLDGTTVAGNQVIGAGGAGGGVAVRPTAGQNALALSDNSTVTGNLVSGRYGKGGGIFVDKGAFTSFLSVDTSHIDGNKVTGTGSVSGGVYNIGGTFAFNAASVNNNIAPNAPAPGGVYTDTAITNVTTTTFTGNTPTNCLYSPVTVTNCMN
ncbi:hypothetical protein [Streptomyces sp. NPDC086787]|uniref:hypothetical protein n=1 Tax=Streptomyces sp. NPDC086787 TaxID=3365759 RepID=UPI0038061946